MANSTQINGVPAEVWNETKVPLLIGTCVFLTILTLATIILRFYARLYARADLWWDDWFALATVPFALASPIMDFVMIHYGFGRHQVIVLRTNPQHLETFGFYLYLTVLFYNIGLVLFKYSFLALYVRIFPIFRWLRYSCYGLAALITIWMVLVEFLFAFRCSPVKASWIPTAGTCIASQPVFLAQTVPTICFDIAVLALPIRLVSGAQLARPTRIGVIAAFLLGGIVTIISIFRLVVIFRTQSEDLSWDYVEVGLWSTAEPIIGLLCCCLPTYAPLLRGLLKKGNTTAASGSGRSRGKNKSTSNGTTTGEREAPNLGPVDGIRTARALRAGYERSDIDSDIFQLTDWGDGRIVKGNEPTVTSNKSTDDLEYADWTQKNDEVRREPPVQGSRSGPVVSRLDD